MSSRWYAANIRPNAERLAVANLARQGFRTFLPQRLKTVRHARQFRTGLAPLFPGYLFLELDLGRERWRSVNGTLGVVALVGSGSAPAPVPAGVVEALLAMTSGGEAVDFAQVLRTGSEVRILAGPFAGRLGTLERLTDQGRVQILLEMMGTAVRITSRSDQLAPA